MSEFDITGRNKIKRMPERGHYDHETVYAIVDEALICHVGIVQDGQPVVIPTIHARIGDSIVLHGAKASRLLKYVGEGHRVCITVTHIDGLVLARSVFHHSMNYRSAVIFGRGYVIEDLDERREAMRAITEHLIPGRWDDARQPTSKEDKGTAFVKINIEDASAKIRTGPPGDEDEDYTLPIWAGIIPIRPVYLQPEPDPVLNEGIDVPDYVKNYSR